MQKEEILEETRIVDTKSVYLIKRTCDSAIKNIRLIRSKEPLLKKKMSTMIRHMPK